MFCKAKSFHSTHQRLKKLSFVGRNIKALDTLRDESLDLVQVFLSFRAESEKNVKGSSPSLVISDISFVEDLFFLNAPGSAGVLLSTSKTERPWSISFTVYELMENIFRDASLRILFLIVM